MPSVLASRRSCRTEHATRGATWWEGPETMRARRTSEAGARRAATLAVALGVVAAPVHQAAAQSATCAVTWAEARFDGGAYDHWVSVSNECGLPISCSVWTDVNPSAQVVPLDPRQV